ncbi:MAG: hypothetical protein EOQ93_03145 [Mesorhizobium sp.]|nr:MAG: hypothetical protein EOQ93_03145 [Mesorhizobium sp.]
MGKRPSKSETLTIRLDPKTRFMLEFVSRLRGQTITTVVERAISEAASRAVVDQEFGTPRGWRDYWSVSEGERALKMAMEDDLHPTFEEERRLAFCRRFWEFFFVGNKNGDIRTANVEVLWSRIDEFIDLYEKTKSTNYFAAGEAMKTALLSANIAPPDWPKKAPAKPERDLDDEIPF